MWYLIVSIPDLCTITYFFSKGLDVVVVLLPLNLGYQLIYPITWGLPSDAYKKYLQFNLEDKMSVAERMKGELLRHKILYGIYIS